MKLRRDEAPDSAASAGELKAAAALRVAGRKRQPTVKTLAGEGPGGRDVKIEVGGMVFGYETATTVGEWADDAIARQPLTPAGQAMILILEAARQGADAAAAAVGVLVPKPRLDVWQQWAVHEAISALPEQLRAAARIKEEISAEWEKLGLPEMAPSGSGPGEKSGYTRTDSGPGEAFSPSVPARMRGQGGRVNA